MENLVTLKVNIKKRFRINGREYGSIEEMPEDVRRAYEKAAQGGVLGGNRAAAQPARVVLNGQEYRSVDDMPAAIRQIYEGTMEALKQKEAEIEWGKDIIKERPSPEIKESGKFPRVEVAPSKIGINPSMNYKIWILGLAIVSLLVCLYFLIK